MIDKLSKTAARWRERIAVRDQPWKARRALLVLMLALFSVGLLSPVHSGGIEDLPPQHMPQVQAEYWWPMVLHEAFLERWVFGSEIVFTYGPWGFVTVGYHPSTRDLAIALRIVVVLLSTLMLWELVSRCSGSTLRTVLVVAALPVVFHSSWPDPFWVWLPFLMLIHAEEMPDRRRSALFLLFVLAAAFVSLTKITLLASFAVVVAVISIDDVAKRKAPLTLAIYGSGLGLWWILAGQAPAQLVTWLSSSFEIVSGYEGAMSVETPPYQLRATLPFAIALLAFFVVHAIRGIRRRLWGTTWWLLGWAAMSLALLRWGFVRADHFHVVPACGVLAAVLITWLSITAGPDPSAHARTWMRAVVATALAGLFVLLSVNTENGLLAEGRNSMVAAVEGIVDIARWGDSGREAKIRFDAAREHSVARSCSARLDGRTDSYPHPDPFVLRDGVEYAPRPAFLSYFAYTHALAERNAADLEESPRDTIVFQIAAIDRRLPSLDDGASWPRILTDYQVEDRCGPYLILGRRADTRREVSLRLVKSVSAAIGEAVKVPDVDSPLFATITLDKSLTGRLGGIFFRTPILEIRLLDTAGEERAFRWLRSAAQSPFLVSPIVESTDDFEFLIRDGSGTGASELTIDTTTHEGRVAYESELEIRFFTLETKPIGESR